MLLYIYLYIIYKYDCLKSKTPSWLCCNMHQKSNTPKSTYKDHCPTILQNSFEFVRWPAVGLAVWLGCVEMDPWVLRGNFLLRKHQDQHLKSQRVTTASTESMVHPVQSMGISTPESFLWGNHSTHRFLSIIMNENISEIDPIYYIVVYIYTYLYYKYTIKYIYIIHIYIYIYIYIYMCCHVHF